MKTVSLTVMKPEKVNVDVDFPIYRKHVFDESTDYTRITEDLKAVTIHIPDEVSGRYKIEIEIEDEYNFDWSDPDYHLGRGKHQSSEHEFQEAWNLAWNVLDSINPEDGRIIEMDM